jgi:hypothetical protein
MDLGGGSVSMNEESSEDMFLKRLVEYMNKRYKKEHEYFVIKHSATEPVTSFDGKKRKKKWEITTGGWTVPILEGYSDGEVFILSDSKYEIDDALSETIYKMLSETIPGYWDMSPDEHYALKRKEYEEVVRKLPDRRTWDELKQKYGGIIAWLDYHDEAAREASEKTGIELIHYIPARGESIGGEFTIFYSHFNSSGMSCDEVMGRIEKALDAIDIASNKVDLYPLSTHEEFKKRLDKFHEFCKRKGYVKRRPSSD